MTKDEQIAALTAERDRLLLSDPYRLLGRALWALEHQRRWSAEMRHVIAAIRAAGLQPVPPKEG